MRSERRAGLLAMLALVALTTLAGSALADPPSEPDHGVNETRFPILWSGDEDGTVQTVEDGGQDVALRQLANGTDLPLNAPPRDVERWNEGDFGEFPETNRSVSIQPSHTDTSDGEFVKDAHATLFAIQPSTMLRLSASRQPLYVGRSGEVLATTDYRVRVPEDDTTGDRQVYWSLEEHRIEETRFTIDGETVASDGGSHTPRFAFDDLAGGSHRIAVETEVFVRLEKHVRTEETDCWENGTTTRCQTDVDHNYTYPTETVTVEDDRRVVVEDLQITGKRAEYPDGSSALAVTANRPWLGYSTDQGNVTGTWRLYSARDPSWDTLVYAQQNESTQRHSPLHPLQVNAFPMATGASAAEPTTRVLATDGQRYEAPTLPENVELGVPNGTYMGSRTIVTRFPEQVSEIRARGFIRGRSTTVDTTDFDTVPIHRSNLTLAVRNDSDSTTRIEVRLRDAATGAPIDTADRDGFVVIDGERVNTTDDGTALVTFDDTGTFVSARYEPGDWWHHDRGYVEDSVTLSLGGPSLQVLANVFRFAVPVGLFLLAAYLIDRITTWQLWPPWRGL
ncbi:hypothetical protein [Halorhabdus rudnickae]|uniref:hypothetical protein n=1 Tax=Halorhabdus rudnickae TaxID=1775544 RepID=UPI0014382C80|nr:hypothetical protein [Halorhabdus rudnickae]